MAARREVIAMNWLGKLPRRTRRSCRFDTRDEPNMRESDYSSPSETCESRTSSQTRPRTILGQESWVIRTSEVEAAVTRQAGHLAPVRFRVGNRWIEPFAIAPWANEDIEIFLACPSGEIESSTGVKNIHHTVKRPMRNGSSSLSPPGSFTFQCAHPCVREGWISSSDLFPVIQQSIPSM